MNLETELAKFWCHGCIVNVLNRGLDENEKFWWENEISSDTFENEFKELMPEV